MRPPVCCSEVRQQSDMTFVIETARLFRSLSATCLKSLICGKVPGTGWIDGRSYRKPRISCATTERLV